MVLSAVVYPLVHVITGLISEREAEILKPLASVEVFEKEDAAFETEISEEDIPGQWKLKGEPLMRSPVHWPGFFFLIISLNRSFAWVTIFLP